VTGLLSCSSWRACLAISLLAAGCSYPVGDFAISKKDTSTSDSSVADGDEDTPTEDVGDDTLDSTIGDGDSTVDDTDAAKPDARDADVTDGDAFDATPCPTGETKCGTGGTCHVTHDDPLFCTSSTTSCGVACAASQYCRDGLCDCRPGTVACGGRCVDTLGDQAACGTSCATAVPCSAGKICDNGICKTGGCSIGRTKCDTSCFDLNNDPDHCGGCAVQCAANEVCVAAGCKQYEPAFGCTTKIGCDCTKILPSSVPCDPFSGTTGALPICVTGTFCPDVPWK
jgi:hypothetical protein